MHNVFHPPFHPIPHALLQFRYSSFTHPTAPQQLDIQPQIRQMKYGQTLQQRSIPLWETCERKVLCSPHPSSKVLNGHATTDNVDYNDIKHLIKLRTTQGQGQPKAIPGSDHESRAFHAFEDELYRELRDQHQRIDLFVQSKSGEIARRLGTALACLPPRCIADPASSQLIWISKSRNWKFEASQQARGKSPSGGWRSIPSWRRLL